MNNVIERQGRVYNFSEALPNNERVNQMRDEQKKRDELIEKEKKEKRLKEEQSHLQEDEIRKQQMESLAQLTSNKNEDEEIKEDIVKVQTEIIKTADNNLNLMIRALIDNVSPYEINFAGVELDIAYYTTLMNILKDRGKSLHTLNLARKGLTDKQHTGIIANMLKENKTLKRLELEGIK